MLQFWWSRIASLTSLTRAAGYAYHTPVIRQPAECATECAGGCKGAIGVRSSFRVINGSVGAGLTPVIGDVLACCIINNKRGVATAASERRATTQ